MSLIQEINRTETEKNKTKQVATNIDNKLVELGGEQAINLADVPNKMEVMVKENYKKIATGEIKTPKNAGTKCEVSMNLEFLPTRIFARISSIGTSGKELCVDSAATLTIPDGYGGVNLSIESISKVKFDFVSANNRANLNSKVINWVAIE